MDWSKAKGIIIMLLLAFNIFLLTNIIVYAKGQSIPRETIQNTINILKTRDVELECAIPTYDSDTPKLVYGSGVLNSSLIAGKLLGGTYKTAGAGESAETGESAGAGILYTNESKKLLYDSNGILSYEDSEPHDKVDVSNINAVKGYVENFLKGCGLIDNSYVLDGKKFNADGSISLYYIEVYKGYFIFDNYLNVNVAKNGLVSLESKRKEIQRLSPDKARDIAAAYQILLGNFNGGAKIVITSIDFGFIDSNAAAMKGIESPEQFPVWRVEIKDADKPRYFNTFDGKEVKGI
jgi:regulatory protein YycI of two-component signal transduction system YycFG